MENQNAAVQHLTSTGLNVIKETKNNVIVACPLRFDNCPGHNASAPTMSVRRSDGSFYCFGCGAEGKNWEELTKLANETKNHSAPYREGDEPETNPKPPGTKRQETA